MAASGEIQNESEGWKKLTDMLHGTYTCNNAKEVVKTIESLRRSKRIELLRIVPKFGDGQPNEVLLNFDFQGKMIGELQIRLQFKGQSPPFQYQNVFLGEVEKICDSKNRQQLLDAYHKMQIYSTNNKGTIDSDLIMQKMAREKTIGGGSMSFQNSASLSMGGSKFVTEDQYDKEELTKQILIFEKTLSSNVDTFEKTFGNLKDAFTDTFRQFLIAESNYVSEVILTPAIQNLERGQWTMRLFTDFIDYLCEHGTLHEKHVNTVLDSALRNFGVNTCTAHAYTELVCVLSKHQLVQEF